MILPAIRTEGRRRGRAFTLVELLLVMAIIGIVTAVVMPSFVRSLRGNRLRTAGRTVVMAGRYARSMAIQRQAVMLLTFDVSRHELTVAEEARKPMPVEPVEPMPPREAVGDSAALADAPVPAKAELARRLDRVTIEAVDAGLESAAPEGNERVTVMYYSNGRCRPYEVTLEDETGTRLVIAVDAFAAAEIETVQP